MEVLVAIALLSVFAPWLMRLPINHYKQQIKRLESLERQRIADWTCSEVKELLIKQSIPWERLPEFAQPPLSNFLPPVQIHLPGFPPKTEKRTFTLQCVKEKEGKQGEIFRLYQLKVLLAEEKFKYLLVLQCQRQIS